MSESTSGAVLTAAQAEAWRVQIRRALFVPDTPPPLNARVHSTFQPEPGVVAERISYGTQFGMRVPAILYRPDPPRAEPMPAFVVVNGHGGDKYSWYPMYAGGLYARGGGVTLTYDPTGEGERNAVHRSGTREHDVVEGPDELAQRLGGLMQTDVMQAVSYLASRADVDASRISAGGYSMGSFVLAVAGAIETRLRACVLVGGGNLDGPGGRWDRSKPMCQGTPYRSLAFLEDRPAAIYALNARRGPTLVYNGTADTTVGIPETGEPFFQDLRRRAVALHGSADGIFETGFIPDVAHRPHFVTRPVVLWLHRYLRFPNWTVADIEAMPTTRISDWAAAHGVEMDPLYSAEEREGGTPALGVGVPGIERDELDVYQMDEWEMMRDQLVHEAWRERARAAIRRA
jgi:dienelactone hydrolase